jgi:hypothetical protein
MIVQKLASRWVQNRDSVSSRTEFKKLYNRQMCNNSTFLCCYIEQTLPIRSYEESISLNSVRYAHMKICMEGRIVFGKIIDSPNCSSRTSAIILCPLKMPRWRLCGLRRRHIYILGRSATEPGVLVTSGDIWRLQSSALSGLS